MDAIHDISMQRGLLRAARPFVGAALTALSGVPVVGALLSSWLRDLQGPEMLLGVPLDALEVNLPRRVELSAGGVGSAWVMRRRDGRVTALCAMAGTPRGLDPLEVEIRDQKVYLRYARFHLG